jgi:hypothetical protein
MRTGICTRSAFYIRNSMYTIYCYDLMGCCACERREQNVFIISTHTFPNGINDKSYYLSSRLCVCVRVLFAVCVYVRVCAFVCVHIIAYTNVYKHLVNVKRCACVCLLWVLTCLYCYLQICPYRKLKI